MLTVVYLQYNDMFGRALQAFSFDTVLIHWLQHEQLIHASKAGEAMGSKLPFFPSFYSDRA